MAIRVGAGPVSVSALGALSLRVMVEHTR
jgi:hypothetical protein